MFIKCIRLLTWRPAAPPGSSSRLGGPSGPGPDVWWGTRSPAGNLPVQSRTGPARRSQRGTRPAEPEERTVRAADGFITAGLIFIVFYLVYFEALKVLKVQRFQR